MKKSNVMKVAIALLFVATVFLSFSESRLLLGPRSSAPIACSYQDLTQNIVSLLPFNSQFQSMEKIHDSYYVIEASDPNGWFWYIYYLGADGLLATNDDNVFLGGSYNFKGKLTEENGLLRLFYVSPSTSPFSNDIFACDLTPAGCLSQTFITNLAANRHIVDILPVDSQDRLYLFLKSGPSAITGNLYSCSTSTTLTDACIFGESYFVNELFSVSLVNSVADFGVIYSMPFTTNQNNFFDAYSRVSSNIQIQSIGILKGNYPTLYGLRRTGTLASSTIELISLNANPQANQDGINQINIIETLTSNAVGTSTILLDKVGNQFVSIYGENNNYVGKTQGQTSKILHPYSTSITFSPMDVLVDKTVVGEAHDYTLSQNKVFSFNCKP